MRLLSRNRNKSSSQNKTKSGETSPSAASFDDDSSQTDIKLNRKPLLFVRSRSTPTSPMTPFRSSRKDPTNPSPSRKWRGRSRSTPRSTQSQPPPSPVSVTMLKKQSPTSIPPSASLELLASLAIDAQHPAGTSSSAFPVTPSAMDSIRVELFPSRHEDDEDDDDTLSAPLLGRHGSNSPVHCTVDIQALTMARTATMQSTEVYCFVDQQEQDGVEGSRKPKLVWETLFPQETEETLANENALPDSLDLAPSTSDDENATENIEVTTSDAINVKIVESPKESHHDVAISPGGSSESTATEEKPAEPVPLIAEEETGLSMTEAPNKSNKGAPVPVYRERSIEINPVDSSFQDEFEFGRVLISVEKRRSMDEPDEQPPRRVRSPIGDAVSIDNAISTTSGSEEIEQHSDCTKKSTESVDDQEEKKEDETSSDSTDQESNKKQEINVVAPKTPQQSVGSEHWEEYAKSFVQQVVQSDTAVKVLKFLRCGNDVTMGPDAMLYDFDNVCHVKKSLRLPEERPLFDDTASRDFVDKMIKEGFTVVSWLAPDSRMNPQPDWSGRAVCLMIEPGSARDHHSLEPKLEWSILPGGVRFEVDTTSISLLSIQSVSSSVDSPVVHEFPERIYFMIKTKQGSEYVFEAISIEERDKLVNGLCTVLARLAYHLIAGDPSAALGLYRVDGASSPGDEGKGSADPWSRLGPDQTMNQMAHILLD